ncbi:MAG: hypothetical protein QM780_16440 [Hyphomicrobium sp.]|uniref:hypothetical protein n=1 Tax=Hyphomicrobium sp. TaxID=82 RepID=UPI0039E2E133
MSIFDEPSGNQSGVEPTSGGSASHLEYSSAFSFVGRFIYFVIEVVLEVALTVGALVLAYWLFVQAVEIIDTLAKMIRAWAQRD